MDLILASASPRRSMLLKQVGLNYRVQVSSINEEEFLKKGDVEILALAKAQQVANSLKTGYVLGADTIVACQKKVLGKPANKEEAREMLRLLSGKTHQVITGVALINVKENLSVTSKAITDVTFRELQEEDINCYISTKEPFDKAGAYGIQGVGALLVEKINGCYYNVVGLPLVKTFQLLKEMGCYPLLKTAKEEGLER